MRSLKRLPYENGLDTVLLAPFASVVVLCVLLGLFFARFCSPAGMRVSGPAVPAPANVIQITVSADNAWSIDGRAVTETQLGSFLSAVSFRKPAVLIVASRASSITAVTRLWQACAGAGIGSVSLVTD